MFIKNNTSKSAFIILLFTLLSPFNARSEDFRIDFLANPKCENNSQICTTCAEYLLPPFHRDQINKFKDVTKSIVSEMRKFIKLKSKWLNLDDVKVEFKNAFTKYNITRISISDTSDLLGYYYEGLDGLPESRFVVFASLKENWVKVMRVSDFGHEHVDDLVVHRAHHGTIRFNHEGSPNSAYMYNLINNTLDHSYGSQDAAELRAIKSVLKKEKIAFGVNDYLDLQYISVHYFQAHIQSGNYIVRAENRDQFIEFAKSEYNLGKNISKYYDDKKASLLLNFNIPERLKNQGGSLEPVAINSDGSKALFRVQGKDEEMDEHPQFYILDKNGEVNILTLGPYGNSRHYHDSNISSTLVQVTSDKVIYLVDHKYYYIDINSGESDEIGSEFDQNEFFQLSPHGKLVVARHFTDINSSNPIKDSFNLSIFNSKKEVLKFSHEPSSEFYFSDDEKYIAHEYESREKGKRVIQVINIESNSLKSIKLEISEDDHARFDIDKGKTVIIVTTTYGRTINYDVVSGFQI